MIQRPWQDVVLVLSAAGGAVGSGLSATASVAKLLGLTPAFLYGRHSEWATLVRVSAVPLECLAFVWFFAVLTMAGTRRTRQSGLLAPTIFVSGLPIAGVGTWLLTGARATSWPVFAATGAAFALVVVSSMMSWPRSTCAAMRTELGSLARAPWVRASIAVYVAALAVAAVGLEAAAQRYGGREAAERDFRRWYLGERPVAAPGLRGSGSLTVVVFTDYQCSSCSRAVPAAAALIDQHRQRGVAIEMRVMDYPLNSKCNAASIGDFHAAACEAAYAVRLTREVRGDAVAGELSTWLYERSGALSVPDIEMRLSELGLADVFRRRSADLRDAVYADAVLGRALGVRGTPAFFVAGVRIPNGPGVLENVLRYEIERRDTADRRTPSP